MICYYDKVKRFLLLVYSERTRVFFALWYCMPHKFSCSFFATVLNNYSTLWCTLITHFRKFFTELIIGTLWDWWAHSNANPGSSAISLCKQQLHIFSSFGIKFHAAIDSRNYNFSGQMAAAVTDKQLGWCVLDSGVLSDNMCFPKM